ncbi:MAG: hypothetical protein LC803_21675 [Acidobacteria bacterium]|nr:hypothetical protein [Acidobacteriota bacterium]
MKIEVHRNLSATGVKAVGLTLAFAAALLATPAPASQTPAQGIEGKAQQVKLDFKQGNNKTGLKLFVERGTLTKVTATDSAGTRDLKRTDKLTVPCPDEERECKTVEMENGTLLDACYCKGSDAVLVALLVPAVQRVREAAGRSQNTNSGGGPRVRVFDGKTGAVQDESRKAVCWADEKLKLSMCPK